MVAYDPSEWSDLFVAAAGATAALAGLVFVAVSINLQRILEFPGLPERALETILLLLGALLVSIVALMPGQGNEALGAEVLGISLSFGVVIYRLPTAYTGPEGEPAYWRLSRWGLRLVGTVPLIVGGLSVLLEGGGGLYWVAGGIVFAILGAVANAWVLLVEILR